MSVPIDALINAIGHAEGWGLERQGSGWRMAKYNSATAAPFGLLGDWSSMRGKLSDPNQLHQFMVWKLTNPGSAVYVPGLVNNGMVNTGLLGELQRRWAPVGASNDPGGLNGQWLSNVRSFVGRGSSAGLAPAPPPTPAPMATSGLAAPSMPAIGGAGLSSSSMPNPLQAALDQSTGIVQSSMDQLAKIAHLPRSMLPSITLPVANVSAQLDLGLTPGQPAPPHVTPPSNSTLGQAIVNAAKQFLGVKYTWGGESPTTGFDCSGLVQYVLHKFGINIARVSEDQFKGGRAVPLSQARPGDLVFFYHSNGDVGHVGIYVGNGQFIQAPHTGDVVKISNLAGYGLRVAGIRRYA